MMNICNAELQKDKSLVESLSSSGIFCSSSVSTLDYFLYGTGATSISLSLSDIDMFLLFLLTSIDSSIDASNIYLQTIRSMISLLTRSNIVGVTSIRSLPWLTGTSYTSQKCTAIYGKWIIWNRLADYCCPQPNFTELCSSIWQHQDSVVSKFGVYQRHI